jgi:ubiquinone/menaquinone biosynthesis C-methylase UbiE
MAGRQMAPKGPSLGRRLRAWLGAGPPSAGTRVLDYRTARSQDAAARGAAFPVPPSLTDWSEARLTTVQDVFGDGCHGPVDPAVLDDFIAPLSLRPRDLVAELGPGLGALTRRLARAKCRVVAYEPNAGLAQAWRRTMTPLQMESCSLHQVDLNEIDFADRKFDYILSKEGLVAVANKPRLLEKMRGAIKLGGMLMLSDYIRSDGGTGKSVNHWRQHEPQGMYPMTMRQWEAALSDAQFEILQVTDITDQIRNTVLRAFDGYSRSIRDMARGMETGRLDWVLAEGEHWALRLGVFNEDAVRVHRFFCRASENMG